MILEMILAYTLSLQPHLLKEVNPIRTYTPNKLEIIAQGPIPLEPMLFPRESYPEILKELIKDIEQAQTVYLKWENKIVEFKVKNDNAIAGFVYSSDNNDKQSTHLHFIFYEKEDKILLIMYNLLDIRNNSWKDSKRITGIYKGERGSLNNMYRELKNLKKKEEELRRHRGIKMRA